MIKKIFFSHLFIVALMATYISCTNPARDSAAHEHEDIPDVALKESAQTEMTWSPGDIVKLSEDEANIIGLETVQVKILPMDSRLKALGKVNAHPKRKAIVSYAFPARISEIHVQIGDWVKSGQELVTLQSEEVGIAKSEFYKANADYELAKVNFERAQRLFGRGVGAQKNILTYEAEFKVAEANLNAAEKKLHVLGFSEAQVLTISGTHQINPIITLFAPLNGKIIENMAILGAMVDQATEILTIMNPEVLLIDAEIYEKDIAKIRIGQRITTTVPAYPDDTFEGNVTYISDVLNEESRTITVRAEVKNLDFKLKPGMFAEIEISLNGHKNTLILPKEAVLDDKDKSLVFLKKDNGFNPMIVEIGIIDGEYIEIISGLKEGDIVVTKGNFQLKSKLYEALLQKGHIH